MHINPIYMVIFQKIRGIKCVITFYFICLGTIKICNFLVYSRERIIKNSKGEKFRQGTKFVLGF